MSADLYRVLVWTGAKVELLYEHNNRDTAKRLYRAATQPAAFALGGDVLEHNNRGNSYAKQFEKFEKFARAESVATPRAPAPSASKPSKAAPSIPPPKPVEVITDMAPIAVDVTHAINPATGKITTGAQDFEELPVWDAEKPETATTSAIAEHAPAMCSKCNAEPRKTAIKSTHPGEETWGAKCRKASCERRRKDAERKVAERAAAKSSSKKVSPERPKKIQPDAPKPSQPLSLNEALDLVEKHAVLIGRLGGLALADELAGVVESNGGPSTIVDAIRRVMRAAGGR